MSDQISPEEQQAWIDAYNDVDWMDWMDLDWDGAGVALPDSLRPQPPLLEPQLLPGTLEAEASEDHGSTLSVEQHYSLFDSFLDGLPMSHAHSDPLANDFSRPIASSFSADGSAADPQVAPNFNLQGDNDDAVPPEQTSQPDLPKRIGKPHRRAKDLGLRCTEPDCTHEGTFPRQYELKRHITAKHRSSKPFYCPVVGCFKGTSATSFARSDKLTAHITATHSPDTLAKCVVPGCDAATLPLDLLVVHARLFHQSSLDEWSGRVFYLESEATHFPALDNASNSTLKHCPYWNCHSGRRISHDHFAKHILAHTTDERLDMQESLATQGYFLVNTASDDGEQGLSLMLTCPLCEDTNFASNREFEEHIVERHMLEQTAGNIAHWRSWYTCVQEHRRYRERSRLDLWRSWSFFSDAFGTECPTCSHKLGEGRDIWGEDTHHLQFLRKEEDIVAELYPHRYEVLRKFPDFWSHPVFNDLKTTMPEADVPELGPSSSTS